MLRDTGIVRHFDRLGRVVVPVETRRMLGFEERDPVEIYINLEDGSVVLKRYAPGCVFCGAGERLLKFRGQLVCRECLQKVCATDDPDVC